MKQSWGNFLKIWKIIFFEWINIHIAKWSTFKVQNICGTYFCGWVVKKFAELAFEDTKHLVILVNEWTSTSSEIVSRNKSIFNWRSYRKSKYKELCERYLCCYKDKFCCYIHRLQIKFLRMIDFQIFCGTKIHRRYTFPINYRQGWVTRFSESGLNILVVWNIFRGKVA